MRLMHHQEHHQNTKHIKTTQDERDQGPGGVELVLADEQGGFLGLWGWNQKQHLEDGREERQAASSSTLRMDREGS